MISLVQLLILCSVLGILGKLDYHPLAESVVSLLGFGHDHVPAALVLLADEVLQLLHHVLDEVRDSVLVKDQQV